MNIETFLAEREQKRRECDHLRKLVAKYKKEMPHIVAMWDTSPASIKFNDINESITSYGLCIYSCKLEDLWAGLYKPSVYEASTLWTLAHDSTKIAKVINAWVNETPLSPIFLVRHLNMDQGLVADGKHRLTVSRAIGATEVPFMTEAKDDLWVMIAFPSAIRISPA